MDTNIFFRQATLRICGSLDIDKALFQCLDFLRQHIPADGIYINIFQPKLKSIRFIARADETESTAMDTVVPITNEMCAALESPHRPRIQIIKDIAEDPITSRVAGSVFKGRISILLMRLSINGKHLGVVGLYANGLNRFSSDHGKHLKLLHKPFALATAFALRQRNLRRTNTQLSQENQYLREQLSSGSRDGAIIGSRGGLQQVMMRVAQVAGLSNTVLLLGETGVGKEVIANAIHNSSPRATGPFIKVNCGAIPDSLIDSELFGHEKGAFTGASSSKKGVFEQADGGTLFLDEVGELPLSAQVRLLRVLQSHRFVRVGGTESRQVDIRIISATHRSLEDMVSEGSFRQDLWFRLNVFPITIPPLRKRSQDIPELVSNFVSRTSRRLGLAGLPNIPKAEMDILISYTWPGNVRELENCVERAMILAEHDELKFDWLSPQLHHAPIPVPEEHPACHDCLTMEEAMRQHIQSVLQKTGGKVHGPNGAARILDINPSTLRSRMKKLGITS